MFRNNKFSYFENSITVYVTTKDRYYNKILGKHRLDHLLKLTLLTVCHYVTTGRYIIRVTNRYNYIRFL